MPLLGRILCASVHADKKKNFTRYVCYLRTVNLERRPSTNTAYKSLATYKKSSPVGLFSPKFLDTLSTSLAIRSTMRCLSLSANYSLRRRCKLTSILMGIRPTNMRPAHWVKTLNIQLVSAQYPIRMKVSSYIHCFKTNVMSVWRAEN